MKTITSESVRHLVLRAENGELLPDALLGALRDAAVTAGWLRASGVLADVELRAFSAETGGLGPVRRIAGPVQVLAVEGGIGVARGGDVALSMRGVLARETERGLETLAGEIVAARVVALEAFVTALDDAAIGRSLDANAGVWLFEGGGSTGVAAPAPAAARPGAAPPPAGPPPAWAAAVAASQDLPHPAASPSPPRAPAAPSGGGGGGGSSTGAAMPPRPVRPQEVEQDSVFPEAGDEVEHFAFGRCEVLKSDGDRLHLKVGKDGRIREIALEMLRVTPQPGDGPRRRFRLDRRM
jgi:predicted DNA-binding protein with PD1-like motif